MLFTQTLKSFAILQILLITGNVSAQNAINPLSGIESIKEIGGRIDLIDDFVRDSGFTRFNEGMRLQLAQDRLRYCGLDAKKCVANVHLWSSVTCKPELAQNLKFFSVLWWSAIQSAQDESKARSIWSSIVACSASPSAVQILASVELYLKARKSAWKGLESEVLAWLNRVPSPKADTSSSFIDAVLQAQENLDGPLPIDAISGIFDLSANWVRSGKPVSSWGNVELNWFARAVNVYESSGQSDKLIPLVNSVMPKISKNSKNFNYTGLVVDLCRDRRASGEFQVCLDYIKKFFPTELPALVKVQVAVTLFEQGKPAEARKKLKNLGAAEKEKVGRWLPFLTAETEIYLKSFSDARKNLADFMKLSKELSPHDKIWYTITNAKLALQERKVDGALNELDQQVENCSKVVDGNFRTRQRLDFTRVVIAVAQKNSDRAKQVIAEFKKDLSGDVSEKFFANALAVLEAALDHKSTTELLAELAKLRPVGSPDYSDVATAAQLFATQ